MQLPSSVCELLRSTTGTRFRKLGLISQTIATPLSLSFCVCVCVCVLDARTRLSSGNFSKNYEAVCILIAVAEENVRAETRVIALTFRPSDVYGVPHVRTLIPEYTCHRCVRHLRKTHTRATCVSENARGARACDRARFPYRSDTVLLSAATFLPKTLFENAAERWREAVPL